MSKLPYHQPSPVRRIPERLTEAMEKPLSRTAPIRTPQPLHLQPKPSGHPPRPGSELPRRSTKRASCRSTDNLRPTGGGTRRTGPGRGSPPRGPRRPAPHRGPRQDEDGLLAGQGDVRVRLHQRLHPRQRQAGQAGRPRALRPRARLLPRPRRLRARRCHRRRRHRPGRRRHPAPRGRACAAPPGGAGPPRGGPGGAEGLEGPGDRGVAAVGSVPSGRRLPASPCPGFELPGRYRTQPSSRLLSPASPWHSAAASLPSPKVAPEPGCFSQTQPFILL